MSHMVNYSRSQTKWEIFPIPAYPVTNITIRNAFSIAAVLNHVEVLTSPAAAPWQTVLTPKRPESE